MANTSRQYRGRRQPKTASKSAPGAAADSVSDLATATSPQDFYQEMVKRPDVGRILTRPAQVPHRTIDELIASRPPGPPPRTFTDEESRTALEEDRVDRWRRKSS